MKLTQLINYVGNDVGVQFLNQCITDIKSTKSSGAKVTFATDAITPNDVALDCGRIGVIVWIPREKWPTDQEIKAMSESHHD